jgi:hypothetical protein
VTRFVHGSYAEPIPFASWWTSRVAPPQYISVHPYTFVFFFILYNHYSVLLLSGRGRGLNTWQSGFTIAGEAIPTSQRTPACVALKVAPIPTLQLTNFVDRRNISFVRRVVPVGPNPDPNPIPWRPVIVIRFVGLARPYRHR